LPLETAGRAARANLSPGLLQIDRAWLCNSVEENQHEIAVNKDGLEIAVPANATVTLRLLLHPPKPN
jgi:hypothetical protein